MGVKGLQGFIYNCCPDVCTAVNLRSLAAQHVVQNTDTATSAGPTLVVDGMACLRHWYRCKNWVCGGQWKEYVDILRNWVEAFKSAGIRLVFIFDGVVEEKKRQEWVKRRRRVNGEIAKIFRHIKTHGEQPDKELFCLPSGLSMFSCFALRSLGQEVFCSVTEADHEIANYAHEHGCMGILGQDSDFIIYNSAPYFSVEKLRINSLTTILYDRQKFCQAVGLTVNQLPLLACILGNDVVSQEQMQHIRNRALATHREKHSMLPYNAKGQLVLAVSEFVRSLWGSEETKLGDILQALDLSDSQRELLKKGIKSYLLPGQEALDRDDVSVRPSACAFQKYVSPEIFKACREKHVATEGFMVYLVVCEGVIECSNTLEDEEDSELIPQALVYKPCRRNIYGLLLGSDGSSVDPPVIREWFVYPGNPLKEPDLVPPAQLSLPHGRPSLDLLWFGAGSDVSSLRLMTFLAIFDCQEFSDLHGTVEVSLLAALCLVTYIVRQVTSVSQEDVDAYLSQCVCLGQRSSQDLQQIKLPYICSRAVQLGSLYVRGLNLLLGANCASGSPLPNAALMPWHIFDGQLFHSKYLLAHGGAERPLLLDNDASCLSSFLLLREKLTEICRKRGRVLESRPDAGAQRHRSRAGPADRERQTDWHSGGRQHWRERGRGRGETMGQPPHRGGWRDRGECGTQEKSWRRGDGHDFHPHVHPQSHGPGPHNTSRPPQQYHSHRSRGRYQRGPRWTQPPAPGT
ncbi:constitutive coactivator of peroxisome proliferator-activated receptor gamma [Cynoglossus semilaevis]|uniref:Family with sequence similarity 120 member B n=1 Tax=Cynoglossus semilaevis TaxID=244447 RepID=A0A3P8W6G0_CYNSE|nr:constitutive coactivator of peroxisome proliferator-activated receptor gamma [Cynoglossus semilaevis]XP_008308756.1 constitutive coactivator of peroxisome proliferator-activated receptor gamma [Cynoglossus semilaevis]XP_016888215.1 constitutive coactivator of peroxisome proliferator-activated receptor gamma [Cynoglossus semilaevis]